jgi:endoglucanase
MRPFLTAAALMVLVACSAPPAAPDQAAPIPSTPAAPATTATPAPQPLLPLPVFAVPTPDPLAACQHDPANVPALPRGTTFHTCGSRILDSDGTPAHITGVSWFGMETGTYAPHGLWTRNWHAMLDQIAALGFNAVRLPFSNEALAPGRMPQAINYDVNPDLAGKTSLDLMDMLIQGAADRGLKVILDRHRPDSKAQSELWYTDSVPEDRWIADWVMLAKRYAGQPALLGMDLHNEPRGPATWGSGDASTDWRLAAQRAGNAILAVNPHVLIFVQGVERSGDDWYWWGGSFVDARSSPVQLDLPGRLVYSPHDYGPGVYAQSWFSAPDFPDNMPAIWNTHWGYLANEKTAPVVLGEFGGRSVGDDAEGVWQRALMDYADQHGIGWLNWSFNPDSGDTGGLLSDDWLSVVQAKTDLYQGHLGAPLDVGTSGAFGLAQSSLSIRQRATNQNGQTNNLGVTIQIANDGPTAIPFSDLEVRYFFRPGTLSAKISQQVDIDYAAVGSNKIRTQLAPADERGVASLKLTFPDTAGSIKPYTSSGDIALRIHKSDWSNYLQQSGDLGLALYRAGTLAWGKEP